MEILILGERAKAEELIEILPPSISYKYSTNPNDASLPKYGIIFDLNFDDSFDNLQYYGYSHKTVFVGAVKKQLAESVAEYHTDVRCRLIGINSLPTFINRSLIELSLLNEAHRQEVVGICKQLEWNYKIVADRVGMVTPRIILMIINEACYTLQEGTAGTEEIDEAMKLGANYPYGPFEWADKIGIAHVYETLLAIYEDTKDPRYKICPLLKTKYLNAEPFFIKPTTIE